MKWPGELQAQLIAGGVALALAAGIGAWVVHVRSKARTADTLAATLQVDAQSADLSREAGNRAGLIIGEANHAVAEDRHAVATARAAGATADDRARVHQRALEAYAAGQDAACRLRRARCGPATPPAP